MHDGDAAGTAGRRVRALLAAACLGALSMVSMGATGAQVPQGVVVCATPDVWTGAARLSEVMPVDGSIVSARGGGTTWRTGAEVGMAGTEVSVRTSYRNDGLYGLRGARRAAAARRGVLWDVDMATFPAGQREAVEILLKAGASGASRNAKGVYFRARREDRDAVVAKAEAILGERGRGARASARAPATVPSFDVAMLRMQGRWSNDPVQFVEALPSGVSVYPFGTSFVAHVPARGVDGMWDQIDMEGERVLLVGASSRPVFGAQASQALRFCGGTGLMGRFPTPTVVGGDASSLVIEAESQRIRIPVGDVVMVVQAPPYGRGIEAALMRVVRR